MSARIGSRSVSCDSPSPVHVANSSAKVVSARFGSKPISCDFPASVHIVTFFAQLVSASVLPQSAIRNSQ